ncbi:magnesium/cobalt transporter CorA [Tianweitania sediminis]|uniref:Magnesium transport protein CorA n=1 Tax=Tianweitania sediminis TaxID=1502156 RepID=A0A8J7UJY4_9HYPH|nr:magnesium/cobalt transporter CorA [Tianweitania sediminis]MBP0440538.1 magnesium/cobalt transporter CorA [Tianweitania sediminis]
MHIGKKRQKRRSPVGAPPGTLIADPTAIEPALSVTVIAPDGYKAVSRVSLAEVKALKGEWPLIWVDCVGLADVALISELGKIFDLHPLALEDTVNTGQRPKTDFYDEHAFVVLHATDDQPSNRFEQISVFFGESFVVTFQERSGDPFDPVRKRLETEGPNRLRTRKGDYLAYALMDTIIDSYFPSLEAAGTAVEALEEDVFGNWDKQQMSQLHQLRRDTTTMKRWLSPLRDAVAGLTRSDARYVTAETKLYLNDTLDHVTTQLSLAETYRDTVTNLIEMHMSIAQARTNDVINLLTIVSTIFIPLTFLAGIWGMNFDPEVSPWNMPELQWYYGYPFALGVMGLVAILLVAYFRWRRWL